MDGKIAVRASQAPPRIIGLIGPVVLAIGVAADATPTPIETIGHAGGGHESVQTMGGSPR
jgi:hypothetical protein